MLTGPRHLHLIILSSSSIPKSSKTDIASSKSKTVKPELFWRLSYNFQKTVLRDEKRRLKGQKNSAVLPVLPPFWAEWFGQLTKFKPQVSCIVLLWRRKRTASVRSLVSEDRLQCSSAQAPGATSVAAHESSCTEPAPSVCPALLSKSAVFSSHEQLCHFSVIRNMKS